jgi:hypothetical protein
MKLLFAMTCVVGLTLVAAGHAQAGKSGGTSSIITDSGGSGGSKPPIVRDHRGQDRGYKPPCNPKRHYCGTHRY